MPFSETLTKKLNAIVSKSETKRSALIPVLREIQNEYGYLSAQSMEEAATMLGISPSSVQNVATFYTMFFTEPAGKHIVWVCRTLSCALRGAEHVEHYMCDKLGIKTGETTPDGKITLMEAECLASCGTAPVMLVDNTLEENLTKARVDQVIQDLRED
ncbi:MAG: NADH-quinone oxidoreductase subunit NuoE [Candidatus Dadabacteria bacterium]|jgi:NADH-quinone oxidoreductase subunit E